MKIRAATVIVPDYQLSLAIGKRGQNARLAAKLTGFKIDIKSESEAEQSLESAAQPAVEAADSEADQTDVAAEAAGTDGVESTLNAPSADETETSAAENTDE